VTQGDIVKETGLIIQDFLIKASGDITKGMLYIDDGAGLVAVTAATAAINKPVMALETRVYATDTANGVAHTVPCVVRGNVVAAKVTSGGVVPVLSKLLISATAGKVGIFVAGTAPGGGSTTYYTTAIDAAILASAIIDLGVVGFATKASVDADTTQEMWLGAT
jgi:hypothetical protein